MSIEAKIIKDSVHKGRRITTYLIKYPRFIHAELMTHRLFSRNSASSRAIPHNKTIDSVLKDICEPIAYQKNHKGMQGTEYFESEQDLNEIQKLWKQHRDLSVDVANKLNEIGVTKQLTNRLLEPHMWNIMLVTATEYDNFFELRCPKYHSPVDIHFLHKSKKDCIAAHSNPVNLKIFNEFSIEDWLAINESQAEIHIQALAELMYDEYNSSTPTKLKSNQWHIPFEDKMDLDQIVDLVSKLKMSENAIKLAISVARCARLSYLTFDDKIDHSKDLNLFLTLTNSKHLSPFEHVAKAMNWFEYILNVNTSKSKFKLSNKVFGWSNNFKGFIPYRYYIEL